MSLSPEPQFDIAARHVELLTGAADTPMWFRLIDPVAYPLRNSRIELKINTVLKAHGSLAEVWPQIVKVQAHGFGVYLIPNPGGNVDRDVTSIRALFVDKDGAAHRDHWFKAHGDERGASIRWRDVRWHTPPDFIVFRGDDTGREAIRQANDLSSLIYEGDNFKAGGLLAQDIYWHAYWRVEDCPVAAFKQAQHRLAAHYGSDPSVCNPARVMRLAGTIHTKGEPRFVNLAWRS